MPRIAPPQKPNPQLRVVDAAAWGWLPDLAEVWERRDLLWEMTRRDLRARYKQMALGPLWFVLQPLQTMVLFTVLFGWVAKLPSQGLPYPVFIYSGLLPWTFFSNCLNSSTSSLLSNRPLIAKVYFPRLMLPLSRILSMSADLAMSFLILGAMLLFYGIQPRIEAVWLPFWLALAGLTGLGTGLCLAGITVHYRDFAEFSNLLGRAWMYATPVVYSLEIIPERWRWLAFLNPMTYVVEYSRWALLGTGRPPDTTLLPWALLISFTLLGAGLVFFRLSERNIADVA